MEPDLSSFEEPLDTRKILEALLSSQQEQAAILKSLVSKMQGKETRSRFSGSAVVGKKDPDTLRGIGLPTAEAADIAPGHGTLVNSDIESTTAFVAPSQQTLRRSARLRDKNLRVSLPLTGETGSIFIDTPRVRTRDQKSVEKEIFPQLPDPSLGRKGVATLIWSFHVKWLSTITPRNL